MSQIPPDSLSEEESKPLDHQPSLPANVWGWWEQAQAQAKIAQDLAIQKAQELSKIAQEKATTIAKQANELRTNYDIEQATSALFQSMGAVPPQDSFLSNTKKCHLDINYVTENIISMSFPYEETQLNSPKCDGTNEIQTVANFLRENHQGHFMVWNVSEESYDYSLFNDQVLEYKFPGHPAPPLGLLLKICTSVESWLDADEKNVAIIHCLTGKGRTSALLACVLSWIGEFSSPMEALQYVSDRRSLPVDILTIPSQRRYVQYFANVLDGVKPRPEPLLLRRVILNTIPIFGDNGRGVGCCPYIQVFKSGRLIASAAAVGESDHPHSHPSHSNTEDSSASSSSPSSSLNSSSKTQLRWMASSEGNASFLLDCPVQGDILIRCRHADPSGARVSMFRAAFHTGYVPTGVLRLTRSQLDGSSSDPRFEDDFFIDLIFAPIEKAVVVSGSPVVPNTSSSTPIPNSSTTSTDSSSSEPSQTSIHSPSTSTPITLIPLIKSPTSSSTPSLLGVPSDSGLVIDMNSVDRYEMTLHKDTRFWDSVAARKARAKTRRSRKFLEDSTPEQFSILEDERGVGNGGGGGGGGQRTVESGTTGGGGGGGGGLFGLLGSLGRGGGPSTAGATGGVGGIGGIGGLGLGLGGLSSMSLSPAPLPHKEVSDEDLIRQLAQAELPTPPPSPAKPLLPPSTDTDPVLSSSSLISSSSASSSSSTPLSPSDDFIFVTSSSSSSAFSSSPPSPSSSFLSSSVSSSSSSSVLSAELQALEDLEKELGLDDFSLFSSSSSISIPLSSSSSTTTSHLSTSSFSSSTSMSTTTNNNNNNNNNNSKSAELDNLEELEQYLLSLDAELKS